MATSKVEYLGNLQTKCTHLKSGQEFVTDAPVDNNGKGSAFSPTDLVATAYASCMITIIGIYCEKHDLPFRKCNAEVTKEMVNSPRRIGKLIITLDLKGNDWDEEARQRVIRAAEACPVARTLREDTEVELNYVF